MKKQWMQMTSLVLNCVLIVLVFWQGARLDDLELEMRRGLNGLETATRSETASVASRVERILDERARVIADYELMPTGLDQETQTLLANWRVTLHQWSADTQVTAEDDRIRQEAVPFPGTSGQRRVLRAGIPAGGAGDRD